MNNLFSKSIKFAHSPLSLFFYVFITFPLSWLAWPEQQFAPLLWCLFIPLLAGLHVIKQHNAVKRKRLIRFVFIYLFFIAWNISTTWWVCNVSMAGGVSAIIANSLLMSGPILLYCVARHRWGQKMGYLCLIIFWVSFEYIHLSWDLSWPWLTLGNGWANYPSWIQWYSYTGILGGSIWILGGNIIVFEIIKRLNLSNKLPASKLIVLAAWIIMPIACSWLIKYSFEPKTDKPIEVVMVQPNIDPVNEKFILPFDAQVKRLIDLSREKITENTTFLLWPETAIDKLYQESKIDTYPLIKKLDSFLLDYPKLALLTGVTTFKTYHGKKEDAAGPLRFQEGYGLYEVYNAGLFIQPPKKAFYHKSKLVPGVEILPYPKVFSKLSSLLLDLGGTTGGYGKQNDRTNFEYQSMNLSAAPSICYESIYGDFMRKYIQAGADFIFIITNDGWWGDSPGYRQHLLYGRLRAIESRRYIARCANTGITAFIDPFGAISQKTAYWGKDVVRGIIYPQATITFYAQYGDYIGRSLCWIAAFLVLYLAVHKIIYKIPR